MLHWISQILTSGQSAAEIPFWNWGMAENLVAETLGILVTVLWVDKIIKRREEKRLLPAKQILNAKIFALLTEVIDGCAGSFSLRDNIHILRFGSANTIQSPIYERAHEAKIVEFIKSEFKIARVTSREPAAKGVVDEARRKLSVLLDLGVTLLEPDMLNSLLILEDSLTQTANSIGTDHDEMFKDLPEYETSKSVMIALEIHRRLAQKADEKTPYRDYVQSLSDDVGSIMDTIDSTINGLREMFPEIVSKAEEKAKSADSRVDKNSGIKQE